MTLLQKIDKNQPLAVLEIDQTLPRHLRIRAVALQWRCPHLQPLRKIEAAQNINTLTS